MPGHQTVTEKLLNRCDFLRLVFVPAEIGLQAVQPGGTVARSRWDGVRYDRLQVVFLAMRPSRPSLNVVHTIAKRNLANLNIVPFDMSLVAGVFNVVEYCVSARTRSLLFAAVDLARQVADVITLHFYPVRAGVLVQILGVRKKRFLLQDALCQKIRSILIVIR